MRNDQPQSRWRLPQTAAIACLVLLAAGCNSSGVYPVEGQVNWKDGSPAKELAGSLIFFNLAEKETTASGIIKPDSSFTVGTNKPDDGALVGEHVVTIIEVGRQSVGGAESGALAPAKVNTKYMTPNSSDLRATVKPGRNKITLTVERGSGK
jgi:hypothetical protein